MNKEYGYARISTPKQNIDRQVRNILVSHPQAHIVKEVYTGTKFQGRKELDKLLNKATVGDTIIFDSVSRMSRNAEEGFVMYEKLFNQGISLVFLKEPHINTDTYKKPCRAEYRLPGRKLILYWTESTNIFWLWLKNRSNLHSIRQRKKFWTCTRELLRESRLPDWLVNRSVRNPESSSQRRSRWRLKISSRSITRALMAL